jgi:riboflavin kinase/FMN adenylyltransferase
MLVFNSIVEFTKYSFHKPAAITIGNFDGVHNGHYFLLENLAKQAKQRDLPTVLLTFKQNTKEILQLDTNFKLLHSQSKKTQYLFKTGLIDYIIYEDFHSLKDILAQDFISDILVGKLNSKLIIVGANHKFGKNREGNYELLQKNCKNLGFEVIKAELYQENGQVISSSLLRSKSK